MKIWLLDADIIIDFLSFGIFDNLIKTNEVFVASSVINEVKFYRLKGSSERVSVDFRGIYINTNLVKELSATIEELQEILKIIPPDLHPTIHSGELESLSILTKTKDLVFCSCDAATIRVLPILDVSERGISAEKLLRQSGLLTKGLLERHTEEYFIDNLTRGKERKIYSF